MSLSRELHYTVEEGKEAGKALTPALLMEF